MKGISGETGSRVVIYFTNIALFIWEIFVSILYPNLIYIHRVGPSRCFLMETMLLSDIEKFRNTCQRFVISNRLVARGVFRISELSHSSFWCKISCYSLFKHRVIRKFLNIFFRSWNTQFIYTFSCSPWNSLSKNV